MMCPASLKTVVVVAAILILTIAVFAAQGRQQPTLEEMRTEAKLASPQVADADSVDRRDLTANQILARQELALIDEAWSLLENLHRNARIELDGGNIGSWGSRRLEALRRAGAGKAEIVAALDKHINDLVRFKEMSHGSKNHHHPSYDEYEIEFLRLEAQTWLSEEKMR